MWDFSENPWSQPRHSAEPTHLPSHGCGHKQAASRTGDLARNNRVESADQSKQSLSSSPGYGPEGFFCSRPWSAANFALPSLLGVGAL